MKGSKRNRVIWMCTGAGLVIISIIVCLIFFSDQPIATVNGLTVTKEEYSYFVSNKKAEIINEYLEDGDRPINKEFWETPVDGETPEQKLKEEALEQCIDAKIQLQLMKEKGIYEDISYQGLYQLAQDYNQKAEKSDVVYGLKSIDMNQFYSYFIDTGALELMNILSEELVATEDEIETAYQEMKEEAAQKTVTVQVIQLPETQESEKKLEQICKLVEEGEDLETLASEEDIMDGFSENTFLESELYDKTGRINEVIKQSFTLTPGEVSNVFSYNNALWLVKCLSSEEKGYYSFDAMNEAAKEQVISEKYDALIAEKRKEADIQIKDGYNQFHVA